MTKGSTQKQFRYRQLFEKSKDAILIIRNGLFVQCNPAAVEMLGFRNRTEVINTPPADLSPPQQPDGTPSLTKAEAMMNLALKNGSHRFEWDHRRADGTLLPVEVLLTTISSEKDHWEIQTIWRDITQRRQMEQARQKEKETLSVILESMPYGITLINTQGKYIYINDHFTQITGYTLDDIADRQQWFEKAYPDPDYRETIMRMWQTDLQHNGHMKIREATITCKNGEKKHIEFRSTFLDDVKITVLTDITERKNEAALVREKDRLQGVLELSGAVCHEMTQPLMSIQGYFDLILMEIKEDHPIRPKIDKIQHQITRISDITKQLMDISTYETRSYLKEKIVDIHKSSRKQPRPDIL